MQLTLAHHPITDIRFGTSTQLDGSVLTVDREALRKIVLEDESLTSVDFAIPRPGESSRAGPIFDTIEPRAKAPGDGSGFSRHSRCADHRWPRHNSRARRRGGFGPGGNDADPTRTQTGRILEMSGPATAGSDYSALQHLIVIPHTKAGSGALSDFESLSYRRREGCSLACQSGARSRACVATNLRFRRASEPGREGLPRVAYIGQIFSRQRKPAVDEPILYGTNTDGMLPVVLHPDEWLDGAIVPSLNSWFGGTETYFYQNHPVILDLYQRHHAREINFVGTVATIAGNDNFDRERQCHAAANLAKWTLNADGVVLTKYGGGLPHTDLAETARLLESMGVNTAVMVSDVARDRRVESALLFNVPEVDAIVYNGGHGTEYEIPKASIEPSHRRQN